MEIHLHVICNSIFHFAGRNGENCYESYENLNSRDKKDEKEAHEVIDLQIEEVMLTEFGDNGLVDSCCFSCVLGIEWKDAFFGNMSKKDCQSIKELSADRYFKIWGEGNVKSVAKYEFPVYIFGGRTTITADVVKRDIPLLISKGEMKKHSFVLDMKND